MICIYHSKDLDGWMSAAIVYYWYKNDVAQKQQIEAEQNKGSFSDYPPITLIGWNYGDPLPVLPNNDTIIMVDISFKPEEMLKLYHQRLLIWIDHHQRTIIETASYFGERGFKVPEGLCDPSFAACELTWKYLFPGKLMPELVRLLGRYDCFGHKGTDEEKKVLEFQYGARQIISNPGEALACLEKYLIGDYAAGVVMKDIYDSGIAIYEYLCTEAKSIYKYKFDRDFDGYRFACINRERFNPVNFGIDYHSDGYDGLASFYFNGKDWEWSLYNDNGKVDCSLIAKNRGGGGHKGAAGFRENYQKYF